MTIQKPDSFELFQRYLNGTTTKDENELIRYWINKDANFKQQLDEYSTLFSGFDELRVQELEKQLKETISSGTSTLDMDNVEQIERYLNNQLAGDELEAFEYRLHTDQEFKAQVDQYRNVFDGLSNLRMKEIEKKLNTVSSESSEKELPAIDSKPQLTREPKTNGSTESGTIRKMFPLIAAAAAMILLLVGLPFFSESDTAKFQRLQTAYNDRPEIENLMSSNASQDSMMNVGIARYNKGLFKEARNNFKHVPTNEESHLYIAHTYYQENQPSMASGFYKALIFSKNSDIRDDAQWFWVQCNLRDLPAKQQDLVNGLRIIVNTEGAHKYKEQAKKLIGEL